MDILLYEKPLKITLKNYELFVGGTHHPKAVRTVGQLKDVLKDPRKVAGMEVQDAYYMYRAVSKVDDIRFDITVIPAGTLGEEYVKTAGHYHPAGADGIQYPEVYQVLRGKATFILQKINRDERVDVVIVSANEGECVVFPPEYGHVTINSGSETLVLSNLVYDHFESSYTEYKKNHGAAYYYVKIDGTGEMVQNMGYVVRDINRMTSTQLNQMYGFSCKDLLGELGANPKKFEFLKKGSLLALARR